jgi:hypothetical protein
LRNEKKTPGWAVKNVLRHLRCDLRLDVGGATFLYLVHQAFRCGQLRQSERS